MKHDEDHIIVARDFAVQACNTNRDYTNTFTVGTLEVADDFFSQINGNNETNFSVGGTHKVILNDAG